ncbi:putative immune-type receptor 4a isoform 1 precursor [Silurus meridionalis]|uniref:Ig-like domain-containing protein n=1 Tax=Silurus meridionalis TaxID=175797 RepID=A0A8T0BFM0_SILME|nr:hypothetical protein HF521_019083 [Silurus meridionalis]KAI5103914.1 putative immune-type receptor 4a isoform 1 precursor [Silurus meridionalis]
MWNLTYEGDLRADPLQKVVNEGDDVILSCSFKDFTGTAYRVYWYRQYPNSKPEFLFFIYRSGGRSPNMPPRMSAKVNQNKRQVDLIISSAAVSDSALYYWGSQFDLKLNLDDAKKKAGESMADPVEPLVPQKVVDQGDDVTLSCSYKGFSGSVNRMYWYRQYPKSKPEFLLYIFESGSKSSNIPPRLDATINNFNKQVDLIISSAAVSDSALYYCALLPTVTENPAALYKNLHRVLFY